MDPFFVTDCFELNIQGDWYLRPWIIPVPKVTFATRSDEDECLILASDGLWDVMSNQEVGEVARRLLRWQCRLMVDDDVSAAQFIAGNLTDMALGRNSSDNISIIFVDLKPKRKRQQRLYIVNTNILVYPTLTFWSLELQKGLYSKSLSDYH